VRLWGDWITRFNTTDVLVKTADRWTITVGPLAPGKHAYVFVVDGLAVPDPGNASVALGNEGFEANLIDVPAGAGHADVAHGVVHIHWYRSSNGRGLRRFAVYTPPGYESRRDEFPLLVLLHGSGGNELGWTSVGDANLIADRLVAERRMKPLLMVMPDGNGVGPSDDTAEKDLLKDVLPAVEARYRVSRAPGFRAIAGNSMGGFQALAWGLRYPHTFGSIGVFSAGAHGAEGVKFVEDAITKRNPQGLFWIATGDKDPLLKDAQALDTVLKKHSIDHRYAITPDAGHTWLFWRQCLGDFLPLLFTGR
jgi:enterochelin esterase family protein